MIFGVHEYLILRKTGRDIRRRQRGLPQLLTARRAKDLASTVARATAFIEGIGDAPSCKVVRPGPKFLELLIAVSCQADSRGNLMFLARCSQVRWSGVVDSASTLAPG